MGRSHVALGIAAMALAACATPGIDYEARIMPTAPEAAQLRNVSVDPFDGPAGRWYTARLEQVLASAQFDGQRWFNVAGTGPSHDSASGVYTGFVDIVDVDEYHSERRETRCVQRNTEGRCIRQQDIIEYCVTTTVDVAAFIEIKNPETGEPIFSSAYPGSASDYTCDDYVASNNSFGIGRALRSFADSPFGHSDGRGGSGSAGALVRRALADTLGPIRRDVAPLNATVRAEFVTKPIDPAVKADSRFKEAIRLAKNDPFASCELWSQLGETYPDAPSVTHNLGACSEAAGDYASAQNLYSQASDLASTTPEGYEVFEKMTSSLSTIATRTSDVESLQQLTGDNIPGAPES